jgi:hypothetical protein
LGGLKSKITGAVIWGSTVSLHLISYLGDPWYGVLNHASSKATMRFQLHLLSLCVLSGLGLAAPTSSSTTELESRQLVSGLLKGVDGTLEAVVGGLLGELRKAIDSGDRDKTLDILHVLEPTKKPKNAEEAFAVLEKISKSKPKTIIDYSAQLIVNGLISGNTLDLFAYAKGLVSAENGSNNK